MVTVMLYVLFSCVLHCFLFCSSSFYCCLSSLLLVMCHGFFPFLSYVYVIWICPSCHIYDSDLSFSSAPLFFHVHVWDFPSYGFFPFVIALYIPVKLLRIGRVLPRRFSHIFIDFQPAVSEYANFVELFDLCENPYFVLVQRVRFNRKRSRR